MLRVAISSTRTVHHEKTYLTADFEAEITGKFEAEGVRDVKGHAIETLRAHFRNFCTRSTPTSRMLEDGCGRTHRRLTVAGVWEV